MIDITFIRENPEVVRVNALKKGVTIDTATIIGLDKKYRELNTQVQDLQAKRNFAAKERNIEEGKKIKEELESVEKDLKAAHSELTSELLKIPNLPNPEVPEGGEDDFEVIKTAGEPHKFGFKVLDHLELGEMLEIIDIPRAAKVSGARFAYLKNEGALLEIALVNFAFEKLFKKGFTPIIPPALIKQEITTGLGYWQGKIDEKHTANENYYLVSDPEEHEDGLYLVGTAEHSIVPMHKNETLNVKDLPKRYVGYSPAFRREAGTYGKDTRGILRMHQFEKVEMVSFVKQEDDELELGELTAMAEELMDDLGLSYRVVRLAARDISFPAAETRDIETWMPAQDTYRETHSISTTGQFQSRRLDIKYQDGANKKYASILNGTAFAIGRTIVAILENYQEENGSVVIPKVLQKYTGFDRISPKK